jgi:hypothetical protein
MRCCPNTQTPNAALHLKTTSLQAQEFSDFHKTGKVDLTDILSATGIFGQGCTTPTTCYFSHPLYSTGLQSQCATGQTAPCVDISTIDTIATYYGHGLTGPFTGANTGFLTASPSSGLVNYDPYVDPFVLTDGTTGGTKLYFQGFIDPSQTIKISTVPIIGNPTFISVYQDSGGSQNFVGDTGEGAVHLAMPGCTNVPYSPTVSCTSTIGFGIDFDIVITYANGQVSLIEGTTL